MTEYALINSYNGYVHKQDKTNLPEGYLVVGSKNVLFNNGEKIVVRKGYTKLEDEQVFPGGIQSCFDWNISNGAERHMRGWKATTELFDVTANTITKVGTSSWASLGFNTTGTVWIGGYPFAYTGGSGTTTLTGVTPDPTTYDFRLASTLVPDPDLVSQGSLEFLYVQTGGTPTWVELLTDKKSGKFNFTKIYSNDPAIGPEEKQFIRFVNGETNVYEWSGGMTTFKSATANTITKQGSNTWARDNFYQYAVQEAVITIIDYTGLAGDTVTINVNGTNTTLTEGVDWNAATSNQATADSLAAAIAGVAGLTDTPTTSTLNPDPDFNPPAYDVNIIASIGSSIRNITTSASSNDLIFTPQNFVLKQVKIGSIVYTYNGGEDTQTLTGVTPNPTLGGHTAGDLVYQVTRTYENEDFKDFPLNFENDYIAYFKNQLFLGSSTNNAVYVSATDVLSDFSFSLPVRFQGEGALLIPTDSMRGFGVSQDNLYIFAGNNDIFTVVYQPTAYQTQEIMTLDQLGTAPLQGALSQGAIGTIKNAIVYVSNEKAFNQLGLIEGYLSKPQNVNLSDPIKLDFLNMDFTDANVFYFDYNIYISLPQEGRVLIFDIEHGHWESPQVLPISCFSIIDGELYGHSSAERQTYKLFDGYTDDGNPIEALALFSYQQFGYPANYKMFNEVYIEGYMSPNTQLQFIINYEVDGCQTTVNRFLDGSNRRFVCLGGNDRSLGKQRLGSFSLARLETDDDDTPPKFRWIPTVDDLDFYEVQFGFYSNGEDQRWQILRFGPAVTISDSQNVEKKD